MREPRSSEIDTVESAASDSARAGDAPRLGWLDRIDRIIARLEEVIMAIGVILMAVNTIANVVARFAFDRSLVFAEELNSIFILLVTFAGIGYAARHGRHIRMSAIYDAMPNAVRRWLMIVIGATTAALMLFLAVFAVVYLVNLQAQGRVYPALGVPVWLSYVWVPVGFFVTGVQYGLTTLQNLRGDAGTIWLSTRLAEGDEHAVDEAAGRASSGDQPTGPVVHPVIDQAADRGADLDHRERR